MSVTNYEVRQIRDLRDLLNSSAELWGDKTAFMQKENGVYQDISYSKFHTDVRGLGTELWARGFAGKKIIVTGENCYLWAVSYMAVTCGLGVVVPVDREIPPEEIANIARVSGTALLIHSETCSDKLAGVDPAIVRLGFSELPKLIEAGHNRIAGGERDYFKSKIDPEALGSLLFTSGTTGVSKGVMLSQKNICHNLMEMCRMIYIGPEDTFLSILPLHHAYECTCGFLCQIYRGCTIAYSEGLRYITRNMAETRPTKMLCVPLLLETMYDKIWMNIRKKGKEKSVRSVIKLTNAMGKAGKGLKRKLLGEIHKSFGGRLELLISGGAPVDPAVISGMRDLGILALQGYGLTECAPIAAVNRDTHYRDKSAGLCLPSGTIDIYDPQSETSGGLVGEIRYRGDNVMLGYFNEPELTAEVISGGWFYTGDLGYLDADGFLHITGRKKNVIVTANGKNIFPEELETYLSRCKFIGECVITGIFNQKKKDYDIVAVVVRNEEYCREKLGENYSEDRYNAEIEKAVAEVNGVVQSYKRINMFIDRETEFEKNTSKKIRRAGIIDEIMPKYKEMLKG